jgi:hypothetical protein
MAIAPLSHSARDYVRAFDLTCIALWRDGRLGVSRNPTGADQAWWCSAKAAGQIARAANANGKDVAAAAARLHTSLTDHATVDQRVTAAVTRIDAGLNMAKQRGAPHRLHRLTHGAKLMRKFTPVIAGARLAEVVEMLPHARERALGLLALHLDGKFDRACVRPSGTPSASLRRVSLYQISLSGAGMGGPSSRLLF